MRVGSLFSGVGGLDLGLERAGMEVVWQVEIDEFCGQVLAKHWPDVTRYEDVREVDYGAVEPVEVLCGGFPCQNISRAGRREGIEGRHSGLWSHFARAIRVIRPRFVLVENTTSILVRGPDVVLGDLAALGYDAEWECLPACAFGAPHIRDRFYLLAYPGGERHGPQDEALRAGWPGSQLHGGWAREPAVGRVADGVPRRVDRLGALGNAVVPQVAEWIGRRIMASTEAER